MLKLILFVTLFSYSFAALAADYYEVLGVSPEATSAEIKSAYRKKVKALHPDTHPNATPAELNKLNNEFIKVQSAYEVLSDEGARQTYNLERSTPFGTGKSPTLSPEETAFRAKMVEFTSEMRAEKANKDLVGALVAVRSRYEELLQEMGNERAQALEMAQRNFIDEHALKFVSSNPPPKEDRLVRFLELLRDSKYTINESENVREWIAQSMQALVIRINNGYVKPEQLYSYCDRLEKIVPLFFNNETRQLEFYPEMVNQSLEHIKYLWDEAKSKAEKDALMMAYERTYDNYRVFINKSPAIKTKPLSVPSPQALLKSTCLMGRIKSLFQ